MATITTRYTADEFWQMLTRGLRVSGIDTSDTTATLEVQNGQLIGLVLTKSAEHTADQHRAEEELTQPKAEDTNERPVSFKI